MDGLQLVTFDLQGPSHTLTGVNTPTRFHKKLDYARITWVHHMLGPTNLNHAVE